METGGGVGRWRREVETGARDGRWRQEVETGGGDGSETELAAEREENWTSVRASLSRTRDTNESNNV